MDCRVSNKAARQNEEGIAFDNSAFKRKQQKVTYNKLLASSANSERSPFTNVTCA
jgi:hypothetical protein